jgi:hypothetical protein
MAWFMTAIVGGYFMREKCGFWAIALAFLSFLVVLAPHQAYADPLPPGTSACDSAKAQMDTNVAQNRSNHAQDLMLRAHNINTLFPIVPALNQCMQNLMTLMQQLPTLADPMNVAGTIVSQLVMGIINQICSQLMGEITQIQNLISSYAKVCLPLPQFNGLDLPTFKSQTCSGGMQIGLISGWSSQPGWLYNFMKYLK